MTLPRATVRLQLHAGFTLLDAYAQVSHYANLGISHFYLSPVSRAVPGSTHGYDVVDPEVISPELGGEAAFVELAHRLRAYGMGIIVDIVPNHMATHRNNRWWWDILRFGKGSAYAEWFDIDWRAADPALRGKVLAPFLARDYGVSLASGSVRLVFDESSQSFEIDADGARYPLAPGSLRPLDAPLVQTLARHDPGTPGGRARLHALLQRQNYVLAWWRCAADRINWRRFFEVSALIGVRVEKQEVFDAVHSLPLRLFAQGLIDGVRVDHVDGLARPLAYCRTLRAQLEARSVQRPGAQRHDEPWIVVEKILGAHEVLDSRWAVDGTTGYDFMDQAAGVLHDPAGEPALSAHWDALSAPAIAPGEMLEEARDLMLRRHFVAEYCALLSALSRLAQSRIATRDWTLPAIERVLHIVLLVFPVYRTYVEEGEDSSADVERCAVVIAEARRRLAQDADGAQSELLDLLAQWLRIAPSSPEPVNNVIYGALQQDAINRFQQLTPPLAAKSLEDTAFYRYGRLLSRNEVGSGLEAFALSPEAFHQHNAWRAAHTPHSMLATATHDQKRGEDVRARLAVLSEIPEMWTAVSRHWLQWLESGQAAEPGVRAQRYMLLQTLVGSWPLDLAGDDHDGLERYVKRIVQWQLKAQREAKIRSSWFEPHLDREHAAEEDVRRLLLGAGADLRSEIERFAACIAPAGAVNSFAQIVLRMTAPGVPDLYQGTAFWDFSLVDPDNRRPVDFAARTCALNALKADTKVAALIERWRDGHIKQALIARVLQVRRNLPELFARGQYIALPIVGPQSAHALAFLRFDGGQAALSVVPRLCARIVGVEQADGVPRICPSFWVGTYAVLPAQVATCRWRNILTDAPLDIGTDARLPLQDALAQLPVAVLRADRST